jgi:ankyrin repeat protein
MFNCGIQVNIHVEVPDNIHEKFTLPHWASYCGQVEVVRLIANRGVNINIRDTNNNTALHLTAELGSVDIIKLLIYKGLSKDPVCTAH